MSSINDSDMRKSISRRRRTTSGATSGIIPIFSASTRMPSLFAKRVGMSESLACASNHAIFSANGRPASSDCTASACDARSAADAMAAGLRRGYAHRATWRKRRARGAAARHPPLRTAGILAGRRDRALRGARIRQWAPRARLHAAGRVEWAHPMRLHAAGIRKWSAQPWPPVAGRRLSPANPCIHGIGRVGWRRESGLGAGGAVECAGVSSAGAAM